MIIDNLLFLRDKVWNVLQTCCIPAFYIVTPDPAFVLQMFANLVSCFSIWISYLSSSSFSLETAITLLEKGIRWSKERLEQKENGKCGKVIGVMRACQPHFTHSDSGQLLFYLVQDMPALNKLQGAEGKKYALSFSINPIFRRGFSKRTLLISNKIASHCRSAF